MTSFVLVVLGVTVFGPELEHCRLGEPVFTSEALGFVGDACGALFTTRDSGHTWQPAERTSLGSFQTGIALSDGSVIFAGGLGQMIRSDNQGQTWARVRLPHDEMLYELSARGANVWACGSSGKILHSGDFGRSWTVTATSPTDSENRSISLDFIDGSHGWVAGSHGKLWKTDNGGTSWTELPLPAAFAGDPRERTIDRVVRVDEVLGFIFGEKAGTWRTRDGGRTWEQLSAPDAASFVVRELPGNRRVLVTSDRAALPVTDWIIDLSVELRPRGKGATNTAYHELVLWEPDGTQHHAGLAGARSKEQPNRDSIRKISEELWSAVGTRRAFFSQNKGISWQELPALPKNAVIERFVGFADFRALARSADGVFRYEHGEWEPTDSPLDARDVSSANEEPVGDPLSCLAQPSGRVALSLEVEGCFGGSGDTMDLVWNSTGGEVHGAQVRKLSLHEVRVALDDLRARTLRSELHSGCSSTTKFVTSLYVTCTIARRDVTQSFSFETHDCGDERLKDVGGATSAWLGARQEGYARALGLRQWAKNLTPEK